jgi:mannose-6-phosphate isomerase-like protein (cupin superfamily)
LFDLRIVEADRGRGVGSAAVAWLTEHLFATHPELRRIEATTRGDNVAMQRVLGRCGYRLEGRMVDAWAQDDGTRFDALAFAILRREWNTTGTVGTARRPELFEAQPLRRRLRRPVGRVIVPPDRDPAGPAFFEWELRGQEWSDEHLHDEWIYVLDGEMHVEADGVAVVAGPGVLVRVPSGSHGTYRAPRFARVLSVYGPRPAHPGDARGVLRDLDL